MIALSGVILRTFIKLPVKRIVKKIDNSVKKAEKAHKIVVMRFYGKLPQREQQQVLLLGAVFGAIRVSAKTGIRGIKNPMTASIPALPENIK